MVEQTIYTFELIFIKKNFILNFKISQNLIYALYRS
jgi:hypothetical protein